MAPVIIRQLVVENVLCLNVTNFSAVNQLNTLCMLGSIYNDISIVCSTNTFSQLMLIHNMFSTFFVTSIELPAGSFHFNFQTQLE